MLLSGNNNIPLDCFWIIPGAGFKLSLWRWLWLKHKSPSCNDNRLENILILMLGNIHISVILACVFGKHHSAEPNS